MSLKYFEGIPLNTAQLAERSFIGESRIVREYKQMFSKIRFVFISGLVLFFLLFSISFVSGGIYFGPISAIKRKVQQLKDKIDKDVFATVPVYNAHELPDTGQEQSYTTVFGEDHDYQPAASQPSYNDNGDGTTTDNRTGLMWVNNGNSEGCYNGGTLKWEQALAFCEGLTYAGYSDWRLPNVRELESIVDAGESSPAINKTYFPNTAGGYWTSTTYMPAYVTAWSVDFSAGFVTNDHKGNTANYVRCVRGGP